ncbi:hypothetical protein [Pseudoalteromonas sp. UBA2102]|uniref:hypothetical protein n=1 Tax=Pseudoalteromonas sp. UBA2102 TaxID=1947291 RepID=UPI00257FC526|nr:hypothetical protein [Pseudoalteromonas sp. UBA2102]|tara:strand:+ start:2681 stop:2884 length:204 start_codon:yes stop_codon:yes gene_type:complete
MNSQPIKNDDELRIALLRVDEIWGAEKGTPGGNELEQLVTLINDYEDDQIIEERINQSEIKVDINDL